MYAPGGTYNPLYLEIRFGEKELFSVRIELEGLVYPGIEKFLRRSSNSENFR